MVIDRFHPDDCLDPKLPFQVSGGVTVTLRSSGASLVQPVGAVPDLVAGPDPHGLEDDDFRP